MSVDLFCFSGTGNSLYVAKKIGETIQNSKIFNLLKENDSNRDCSRLGIIFPVYGFSIPAVVKKYLLSTDFSKYDYIFAVSTKGGSPEFCYQDINKLLGKKGKMLSAYFTLKMPNNSYFIHDFDTEDEIKSKMEICNETIAEIITMVNEKKRNYPQKLRSVKYRLINYLVSATKFINFGNHFYIEGDCTGCGVCQEMCPSKKIEIIDKKPVWKKDVTCYTCTTCLNYCPSRVIKNHGLKASKTQLENQYRNQEISISDMKQWHNYKK